MDRYILTELLVPFLFGVGLFSSVAVAIGSVFDLVRRIAESGLLIELALRVLILKMPQFIVYAFPMSMVLASLMAYSRLSSDSEIVALRSCGVSVYRLVVPALVMGVIVTGVTFIFYESVVPAANYQASLILEKAANEERPLFQERNLVPCWCSSSPSRSSRRSPTRGPSTPRRSASAASRRSPVPA